MKSLFYPIVYTIYSVQKQYIYYIWHRAISIFKNINKSDVMDWMITYQDVRRNMCEAEKIYANDKVSMRRIEEENEKKRLAGTYNSHKTRGNNENDGCVHLDASKKTERDRSTNTREQRAKIAGVGNGTVARYDAVMKSGDETLKKKVFSGETSISAGYKELTQSKEEICFL